jgi:hypothetical protein
MSRVPEHSIYNYTSPPLSVHNTELFLIRCTKISRREFGPAIYGTAFISVYFNYTSDHRSQVTACRCCVVTCNWALSCCTPLLLPVGGHVYGPAITSGAATRCFSVNLHEHVPRCPTGHIRPVLTVLSIMIVFWYLTPCRLEDMYQLLREHPASILKVEVKCRRWNLQVPPQA